MDGIQLLKGIEAGELSAEDEEKALQLLAKRDIGSLLLVSRMLAKQRRVLRTESVQARAALKQLEAVVQGLRAPPWYPATVLRVTAEGRVDVACGGRRQIVGTGPELDTTGLRPGDEVFLNGEMIAVARSDDSRRTGVVGTVSEVGDQDALVRAAGEEELRALCPPELAQTLRPGDRVLFARDFPYLVERLPQRTQSPWILEQPCPVRFADIGGLDGVIRELRRDLDLHLLHRERVAGYRLRLLRGVTLVGPPGVGKTMLARAIAFYLYQEHPGTRFLRVPPGAFRGMYYGQTEGRIRELFAVARAAPGLVVLFLDELDSYGARGLGAEQTIDGRVLGTLLGEIDGIDPADDLLCIGATNRLDLCDPALVRDGRLGDRIYPVPRPDREATRQILATYLTPDLPFAHGRSGPEAASSLIDAAVSYLHAPRDGAGAVATVVLSNSQRREVPPRAVLSGALLASAVEHAKHLAAQRHLEGGEGIALEDLLSTLDAALSAEARKLASPAVARQTLDIEGAEDIVLVELPAGRRIPRHRYLRAA